MNKQTKRLIVDVTGTYRGLIVFVKLNWIKYFIVFIYLLFQAEIAQHLLNRSAWKNRNIHLSTSALKTLTMVNSMAAKQVSIVVVSISAIRC